MSIISFIFLIKSSSTYFIILSLIKLWYAVTNRGLMMKLGKSWIRKIKQLFKQLFKQFISKGKLQSYYDPLQCIRSNLVESIRPSNEKVHLCLSAKLSDPCTTAKTYWSIRKTFVNSKKSPVNFPVII